MRLAKTAVGVSRWVKRLQDYSIRPPEGLVTNAQRSLEASPAAAASPLLLCVALFVCLKRAVRGDALGARGPHQCCSSTCSRPSMQLMEITKHMAAAVQEEYIAK